MNEILTDKRQAMVDELLDFVENYKENHGVRPTQQEIDDFIYSWRKK